MKRGMMESPFGAPKTPKSGEWDIYVLGMFNIAMVQESGAKETGSSLKIVHFQGQ